MTSPAIFQHPQPSLSSALAAVVSTAAKLGMASLLPQPAAGMEKPEIGTTALSGEGLDQAADFDSLLADVRRGSDAAARQLVDRIYPVVIRIVRSHLPVRCDEEDVAQEVFLKMFSRLEQFRGDSPFPHWVSRIATNTCLDLLRHWRSRREIRFADLTETEEACLRDAARADEAAPEETPSQDADSLALVDKLLSSLKPDQQLVVRLMEVERQSVREVCGRTGWSASKVKMTALRARRKLAGVLGRLGISLSGGTDGATP